MSNDSHLRWPNLSTTPWLRAVEKRLGREVTDEEYTLAMRLYQQERKTPAEASAIITDRMCEEEP